MGHVRCVQGERSQAERRSHDDPAAVAIVEMCAHQVRQDRSDLDRLDPVYIDVMAHGRPLSSLANIRYALRRGKSISIALHKESDSLVASRHYFEVAAIDARDNDRVLDPVLVAYFDRAPKSKVRFVVSLYRTNNDLCDVGDG
jgi:hypothetical protein